MAPAGRYPPHSQRAFWRLLAGIHLIARGLLAPAGRYSPHSQRATGASLLPHPGTTTISFCEEESRSLMVVSFQLSLGHATQGKVIFAQEWHRGICQGPTPCNWPRDISKGPAITVHACTYCGQFSRFKVQGVCVCMHGTVICCTYSWVHLQRREQGNQTTMQISWVDLFALCVYRCCEDSSALQNYSPSHVCQSCRLLGTVDP